MASSPFVFFAWCFVALASSTVTHALSVPQGSAAATYGRSSAASLTPIRSVRQLHNAYNDIFKTRNRNAASHLWISYLLERAPTMTSAELQLALTGFCAVSGSPVTPHDYNRRGCVRLDGGFFCPLLSAPLMNKHLAFDDVDVFWFVTRTCLALDRMVPCPTASL
jgi:hypothetical protein